MTVEQSPDLTGTDIVWTKQAQHDCSFHLSQEISGLL